MSDVDRMPTWERFLQAAELLDMSPQELGRRLGFSAQMASASPGRESVKESEDSSPATLIPVHARYLGKHVEATFESLTGRVKITSGPLGGMTFASPSAAAIAVVESINPQREFSNTNGRTFWTVTATGRSLRSLLGRR
jgi:hypothetical protein